MMPAWKAERLSDFVDLLTGFAFESAKYSSSDEDIRLLRGDNVVQGAIRWENAKHWPSTLCSGLERYLLQEGDVVVALDRTWTTAGLKIAKVASCDVPSLLVQRVARVRALPGLDQDYLYQLLRSHIFELHAKGTQTETAVPHISPNDIRDLSLRLPPIREQRRIAQVLAVWDQAIETAIDLVTLKRRRFEMLREHLFAPDGSERIVTFGDVLSESRIPGSDGARANKLTVKLYGKGVVAKEPRVGGSESTRYFIRRSGQFIYSKLDFLNGAFGLVPPELDQFESTLDLPTFDICSDVNPSWLVQYLSRPSFYEAQVDLGKGQRIARRVNPSDFIALPLPLPPRTKQDAVIRILTEALDSQRVSEQQLNALRTQKRGLMQKLLAGEWRLSSDPSEQAA